MTSSVSQPQSYGQMEIPNHDSLDLISTFCSFFVGTSLSLASTFTLRLGDMGVTPGATLVLVVLVSPFGTASSHLVSSLDEAVEPTFSFVDAVVLRDDRMDVVVVVIG